MKLYDNDAYREEFMALVYELLDSDGTNDRANQIIDAFDSAPEVEAEPVQPNAPLTLEELREMDGEPVWCEKFEWRICYGVSDFRGCLCMETGAGSCIQLNDYGKTWRAYRRKPEEGTP